MIEKDISIGSGKNRLCGTVCLPQDDGRFPVVLMLHGSGPFDRDENIRWHGLNIMRLEVFNTLARFLAGKGIASVRYDKRGCGKSSGNYWEAGYFDLVDDAVTWVEALAKFDFCDPSKVILLGHSEGCDIAAHVHARCPSVAGLVLLCPSIDDGEALLIKQAARLQEEISHRRDFAGTFHRIVAKITGPPVARQRRLIEKVKASDRATMWVLPLKIPAKWFRECLTMNARAIFATVSCPMCVMGGEKDAQCDPADVDQIAALSRGAVTTRVVPNLTHLLRLTDGPASLIGSGKLLKQPLAPIVLELVGAWLTERLAVQAVPSSWPSPL